MLSEALKGHLDLLLMAVLENGPAHGYAIIDTLRRRSEGTFDLAEGTIYPALHRLEDNGSLTSQWSEEAGRRRRVYALTQKGRQVLVKRQQEWRQFSQAVESTVGLTE